MKIFFINFVLKYIVFKKFRVAVEVVFFRVSRVGRGVFGFGRFGLCEMLVLLFDVLGLVCCGVRIYSRLS